MTTATAKTNPLASAFLAAQSEFPEIPKDSEADAGSYKYRYGSLPAILRAVKPVLHKHGFSVLQPINDGTICTTLLHESGQEIKASMECSAAGLDPQSFGKKITYYKRYALTSMLGICPDDDPDCVGVDAPETPRDVPREPLDDEADTKYHDAVSGLMARGVDALRATEKLDRETAWAEMESRKLTVLGHEGHESEDEITHRQARVEFYSALEKTVKAIEDKAGGGE